MNFISAELPENEERRAEAVERTGLIDSDQASLFNIYCELAKDITGYESVLFQLFDSKERCYLAQITPDSNETQNLHIKKQKEGSVCSHVLLQTEPFIAFDVTKHEVTKNHENTMGVKSYIGFPLIDKNNYALGIICMFTFSKIKKLSKHRIELVQKLVKKAAHQIDVMTDQKQLTSDRIVNAIDIFNQETDLNDLSIFKNFIYACNKMQIDIIHEKSLIENNLCVLNNETKLDLTDKGKLIQDKMGLHTKIMKNVKLEGNQANEYIEGMLNEL